MSKSEKRDCNCGEGRGPVDPSSFRILDVDAKSLPEPGVEAKPRGYSCSGCKDGSGLIYRGAVAYHAGTRTCSIMLPIKISADGVITWKRVEWVEQCQGSLVNDPWA